MFRSLLTLTGVLISFSSSSVLAQPVTIQNDNVRQDSEAVVSCGFCASEKFGTMFFAPQLNSNQFPLDLKKVFLAMAGVSVTLDLATFSYACEGVSNTGTMPMQITAQYEVYAGVTPPSAVAGLPATGGWPSETVLVPPTSTMITLSSPQPNGQWQLNFQEIALNGITVAPPNTYLRVVVTIPIGSNTHDACSNALINLSPPGGVAFRDTDITGSSRRNFIYAAATLAGAGGWIFNEDFQSSLSPGSNINGDWLIRVEIEPHSTMPPSPDASVPNADASVPDMGFEMDAMSPDMGTASSKDAGTDSGTNVPEDSGVMIIEPDASAPDATAAVDSGPNLTYPDAKPAPVNPDPVDDSSCACSSGANTKSSGLTFPLLLLMGLLLGVRRRSLS